jgi:hypothetical protein
MDANIIALRVFQLQQAWRGEQGSELLVALVSWQPITADGEGYGLRLCQRLS